MGRGRGKGKKFTVTSHDDPLSGDEEKIPAQKRRGRPQKLMVDEIDEETEKIEEEEEESENGVSKSLSASDNGKKRRRNNIQAKEKSTDSVKEEENSNGTILSTDDLTKQTNGFRHNGSRRKSTPRRAAEAGVECVCRVFVRLQLFIGLTMAKTHTYVSLTLAIKLCLNQFALDSFLDI